MMVDAWIVKAVLVESVAFEFRLSNVCLEVIITLLVIYLVCENQWALFAHMSFFLDFNDCGFGYLTHATPLKKAYLKY